MIDFLRLLACALTGPFQSRARLEVEILVLRHQLNVLRRKAPKRVALRSIDRLVFAGLYCLAPGALNALKILKPETVIRWHRAGFRTYWRRKSRAGGGRPKTSLEVRQLIRDMSIANPLWGAPRIHGELLMLGIDVGQTTVAKYMVRLRRLPSQGWKTFLRNHTDGEWIARQLTEAYDWAQAPQYMIRDRDRVYGDLLIRRLRAMGIRDRPIAPRSPWQNGHTERLIGSIRRECLDHVVVFGEQHLRQLLGSYQRYYNDARTHLSLNKDAPASRTIQVVGRIVAVPHLGALHHQYVRI
jgi:hypothetical protein